MNIVEAIFEKADKGAIALKHGDATLCYGDLLTLVHKVAAVLAVEPQARVGLSCPNGFDHVILSLAVLKSGGVLVPIPSELALPEQQHLVDKTRLHAVLSTPGQDWQGREGARTRGVCEGIDFALSSEVADLDVTIGFEEAILNQVNPGLIRFSSGTTGKSKGVVLSHQTLLARVQACNAGLGIGPGDRVIWMLPMAHHFAVSIVLYLLHGATTVIVDSHLGEDVYNELIAAQGTVLYAAPFHYAMLAGYPGASPVPSLRLAVSTASALAQATADQFQKAFGLPLCQGFGIIEAGLPILNQCQASEKPESIGRPQKAFAVSLREPDAEGSGELLLRGPGLFDAYLDPWQPREVVLNDGWFATGDLARKDVESDLFLCGRLKSVINVAGLKCFPEEIEAVLDQHPDLKESRVYALPHPQMGSVPAAEVVPADSDNPPKPMSISKFCKAHLAQYKIPMRYQMVDKVERTASGKIKR